MDFFKSEMNTTNEPTPHVAATPIKGIADLQQIDILLDEAEPYLAEAIKALAYPEVFGLPQSRALGKLRAEIEMVHDCIRLAKTLSESAWLDDE